MILGTFCALHGKPRFSKEVSGWREEEPWMIWDVFFLLVIFKRICTIMVNHTMVSPPFLRESNFSWFTFSKWPNVNPSSMEYIVILPSIHVFFDRQFGLMMPLMALHQRTPRMSLSPSGCSWSQPDRVAEISHEAQDLPVARVVFPTRVAWTGWSCEQRFWLYPSFATLIHWTALKRNFPWFAWASAKTPKISGCRHFIGEVDNDKYKLAPPQAC